MYRKLTNLSGWLVQRGMLDKAEHVLAKTHKNVPGYDVKSELVGT